MMNLLRTNTNPVLTTLVAFPVYILFSNGVIYSNRIFHLRTDGLKYYLVGSICNAVPITEDINFWFLSFFLLKLAAALLILYPSDRKNPNSRYWRILICSFFILDLYSGLTVFSDQQFSTQLNSYFFSSALLLQASYIHLGNYICLPLLNFVLGNFLLYREVKTAKALIRVNFLILLSTFLSCIGMYFLMQLWGS